MRIILTIIIILTNILCFGQIKQFHDFSDSVQFFWPNNNLQYQYTNIFSHDSILNSSTVFVKEQFFSEKTGELISYKKFERKYGIEKINELRKGSYKYLNDKNEELKTKNALILKEKFEKDSLNNHFVLDILKQMSFECENMDTIKIKHGLLLGLGRVYFFTTIKRVDNDLFIENFIEELHSKSIAKDSSIMVQNLIPHSDCSLSIEKFISKIDAEKEKCWRMENKTDNRWTFQFDMCELMDEEVSDFFGYNLYHFLNEIICE